MKNLKITKRDVKVFLLGVFTMLMIESIYNWDDTVKGFKDGFNSVSSEAKK